MTSKNTLLSRAIEEYLEYRSARYSEATVRGEAHALAYFATWYGRDVQVQSLRPEKVEAWFTELRSPHTTPNRVHRPPVSANTHNVYRKRMRAFFSWLTRRGALKVDLLAEVPALSVHRRQRIQPPPSVLADLPNHATNARDRALIALSVNTGLRRNSVLLLTVEDVDLDEGWLRVQITKSHRDDAFPISSDLEPELHRWLRQYAKDLGRPLNGQEWLLPARTGPRITWTTQEDGTKARGHTAGSWVPERAMTHPERVIQDALRSAGLDIGAGEGMHTIRRGLARAFFDSLSEQGHDSAIKDVGAMLHHSNSSTTEVYLGLSQEVERRNALIRGRPLLSTMTDEPVAKVINLRL
ncbi:tyrosine-type recombinase/integrase [Ornithinimicrobium cryptoxanthini]|uniref:tyrosine-type recombinase/integrase n=1 Tax=Ornithinimicrobium cryptoxanthini TaxID=2934161 RepID=UPI002118B1CC|nr:site-specific integrase [Ornithinimicrobium cryptoxanthini]